MNFYYYYFDPRTYDAEDGVSFAGISDGFINDAMGVCHFLLLGGFQVCEAGGDMTKVELAKTLVEEDFCWVEHKGETYLMIVAVGRE